MMRKGTVLGLFALLAVGMVISTSLVSAYGPWRIGDKDVHEDMQAAIESGDFATWKDLMQSQVTQERFEQIQQREQNQFVMRESREEMQAALEAGDYDLWISLVEELDRYPVDVETITEDDFNILVEMHNARISGDWETADELADKLGWERPGHMGIGQNGRKEGFASGQGRGQGQGHARMMQGFGDCPLVE